MTNETNNSELQTPNSELPPGWRWVKLGEVCSRTENRDPRTTPDLPFRYVDISSIDNHSKRIIEARIIQGKDAPSRARQVIKANDVIVATTRPNLNAVALVPEELDNEICSTGFCILRPTELIDPSFLFTFVQSKYFIEEISGQVRGMLYPAVTDNQVRNVYLALPSLSEQKRIAAKIQELMQEVERARSACEKQSEAAKALADAYLREVFESEGAKKWERKKLGEVCEIIMGQSPPSNSYNKERAGLPFFQGKADFGVYSPMPQVWCSNPMKISEANDILISVRAPVGPVNMADQKCCIGRGLTALRGNININSWFVFFYFRSIENNWEGRGSTFDAIRKKDLEGISIPCPSLSEQNIATSYLKQKFEEIENLQSAIQNQQSALSALPQSILRKAFSGEL
ncbi:MAG: restriction endonuclease subunit S [Thermodesulfobacteriota bacterium]